MKNVLLVLSVLGLFALGCGGSDSSQETAQSGDSTMMTSGTEAPAEAAPATESGMPAPEAAPATK